MSKAPLRKNHTLFALAIVYAVIAILQVLIPGMLPIHLYFSIAFISFLTALCEFVKSSANWIRTIDATAISIALDGERIIGKEIELIRHYPVSSAVKEHLQAEYDALSKRSKAKRETRWDKYLARVDTIIPFVEIFEVLCIAIITPLVPIPDSVLVNKIINIISLLSIALAFLSIHMSENTSSSLEYYQEQARTYCQTTEFFLSIMSTISENPPPKESEKSRDDNN